MALFLIQTDFDNEVGDITLVKAKDIIEAGNIYKSKRIKSKFVKDEYYGDFVELEDWTILVQNSSFCLYRAATGVSIIIFKIPNNDECTIIGRYGKTEDHRNLFDFIENDDTIFN